MLMDMWRHKQRSICLSMEFPKEFYSTITLTGHATDVSGTSTHT